MGQLYQLFYYCLLTLNPFSCILVMFCQSYYYFAPGFLLGSTDRRHQRESALLPAALFLPDSDCYRSSSWIQFAGFLICRTFCFPSDIPAPTSWFPLLRGLGPCLRSMITVSAISSYTGFQLAGEWYSCKLFAVILAYKDTPMKLTKKVLVNLSW